MTIKICNLNLILRCLGCYLSKFMNEFQLFHEFCNLKSNFRPIKGRWASHRDVWLLPIFLLLYVSASDKWDFLSEFASKSWRPLWISLFFCLSCSLHCAFSSAFPTSSYRLKDINKDFYSVQPQTDRQCSDLYRYFTLKK